MIKHIVWWTLKPEADGHTAQENAARIKKMGEALNGRIPGLLSLEITSTFLPSTTVAPQLLLFSAHPDEAALKAYAQHPLHLELGALIKACTASREAIDYVI